MPTDWSALWLSLRVAGLATAVSLVAGLWLGWVLLNRQFPGKRALAAVLSAALVLPAPIVCYYALAAMGRLWPVTAAGLVAAGVISAAPLLARAARTALGALDPAYGKAARSLGASDWRVWSRIELPLAARPLAAAAGMAFARLLAELAAVRVIAARLIP